LESLSENQLQVFSQQVLIAVGARTAQVLSAAGLSVRVPEQISSEGLLAMTEFKALQAGDSLMILRGQGGRRLIDEVMSARGILVDELILYKRCEPDNLEARYAQLKKSNLTQVLITSFESWQRFVQIESDLTQYRYLLLGERLLKLIAPDLSAAAAQTDNQPDMKFESQPDLKCGSQPAATFDPKSLCHVLTDLSPTTIAKAYLTWT
jgi:uroporphyrinogen-III synthase